MLTKVHGKLTAFSTLAIVVLSLAGGCGRSAAPPNEVTEKSIIHSASIAGFQLVRIDFVEHSTSGIFIGPQTVEPLTLISVDNFTLGPAKSHMSTAREEELYDAHGTAPDGRSCGLYVFRLRHGMEPTDNSGFNSRQLQDLTAGKATMLDLEVACDSD